MAVFTFIYIVIMLATFLFCAFAKNTCIYAKSETANVATVKAAQKIKQKNLTKWLYCTNNNV